MLQGEIVVWDKVEQMLLGWPVIEQIYSSMSVEQYQERLEQSQHYDYRQFAYLDEDHICRGVVGLWFLPRVWCGLQADIDNFVIDRACRSSGIGKMLLDHCLDYARERGAMIAAWIRLWIIQILIAFTFGKDFPSVVTISSKRCKVKISGHRNKFKLSYSLKGNS
jgi:GNAT superfamily N-acetyltransferase